MRGEMVNGRRENERERERESAEFRTDSGKEDILREEGEKNWLEGKGWMNGECV